MQQLNAAIRDIPIPARMARRPLNERGFPVPWFVANIDGKWDFRGYGPDALSQAVQRRLCWLCGEPLGRYMAFVIGPMCSINRISSEPPSHRECAEYAVKACPFLSNPNMRRNEKDLPEGTMPGNAVMHNPGATLIWITKSYRYQLESGGVLFRIGEPEQLYWFKDGRTASRAEILAAIDKGLPHLRKIASEHGEERELQQAIDRAMVLVPT